MPYTDEIDVMTAKLVAEEGLLKDLVLSLQEGDQWVIGRDPDACQLLVEDPVVSRKHALCRQTPHGIVIENLSATNPILVNDEVVSASRLLHQGDAVRIGDTLFRFSTDAPVEAPKEEVEEALAIEEPPPSDQEEAPQDTIFDEEGEGQGGAKINFDLMDTGRWLLKVVGGPNNGAEFPMQTGTSYIVGTDPNACDIVFYDTSVSRQHVRITVDQDDTLAIEDLKSRNGTRVEGELLESPTTLIPNTLVTLGTTSFVVYDREGEMQTIISPLLPSIVRGLQKEEIVTTESTAPVAGAPVVEVATTEAIRPAVAPEEPKKKSNAWIALSIVSGLIILVGLGAGTLFMQAPIEHAVTQVNADAQLTQALEQFPNVKYSFNQGTGQLLLVGHVLTATDRSQLLYNLQSMKFIKDIDDSGVIIDEYVWREANQLLSENSSWKGVTIYSPSPGKYVLTGYMQSRDQAEKVWDYLTRNFPYVDLLENKIVIEEDIVNTVTNALRSKGLTAVNVEMHSSGELVLSGSFGVGKQATYDELIQQFKELAGVRSLVNLAREASRGEGVINVSSKYTVSGSSQIGGRLSVVVNGRILTDGDVLDGMKITSVQSNVIILEKDGIIYRIDYGR